MALDLERKLYYQRATWRLFRAADGGPAASTVFTGKRKAWIPVITGIIIGVIAMFHSVANIVAPAATGAGLFSGGYNNGFGMQPHAAAAVAAGGAGWISAAAFPAAAGIVLGIAIARHLRESRVIEIGLAAAAIGGVCALLSVYASSLTAVAWASLPLVLTSLIALRVRLRRERAFGALQIALRDETMVKPSIEKYLQKHIPLSEIHLHSIPGDTAQRGTVVLDARSLARDEYRKSIIGLGGIEVPNPLHVQHAVIVGAPGTGKSVAIKTMLRAIRERGERAIVYDPAGDFTELFFRDGVDHIIDPSDERDERWTPWADASEDEYPSIARSLIPTTGGESGHFFAESARTVLEALLCKHSTLSEMRKMAIEGEDAPLVEAVKEAKLGGVIGDDRTFSNTRATLVAYIRSLSRLRDPEPGREPFSFRKWSTGDSDSWVFLPGLARTRDAMRPVLSLILDTAVRVLMDKPRDVRTWLVLDELPTLQKLPALMPAIAEGRKFGICVIAGYQTTAQMRAAYGKDDAIALTGLPKTRLVFRVSDPDTADAISREIGEVQVRRTVKSTSSENNSGGALDAAKAAAQAVTSSTSEQYTTERAVLPSEITALPDLAAYLRVGSTTALVHIPIAHLPPAAAPAADEYTLTESVEDAPAAAVDEYEYSAATKKLSDLLSAARDTTVNAAKNAIAKYRDK